jgi:xanthine dehydrogenase large subunit
MMGIERVIEAIAAHRGLDPLAVRRINLYGGEGRNITPYHMTVEDNILPQLLDELEASAAYARRRKDIEDFNRSSAVIKLGIALTPVKFGISFTTTFLNQAGALVQYRTAASTSTTAARKWARACSSRWPRWWRMHSMSAWRA